MFSPPFLPGKQVRGNFVVSPGTAQPDKQSASLTIRGALPPTLNATTVVFQASAWLGAGGWGLGAAFVRAKGVARGGSLGGRGAWPACALH
jgi:hypothetical protein